MHRSIILLSCSPTLLSMVLAAMPRLMWPFKLKQHISQICCHDAAFENLLNQLEIDSRISSHSNSDINTAAASNTISSSSINNDEGEDGGLYNKFGNVMDNSLSEINSIFTGVHTIVYNTIKAKGITKTESNTTASGNKIDMLEILTSANVYVFDLDACKVR
jgi:hypothetical protein